jgi:predicted  nucleic acid-binding Zn-ribbon protein
MIVRDKDRDIKRLKNEAEDLRDLIISKEQKISEMEVEKAKLQAEIKTIRSEQ